MLLKKRLRAVAAVTLYIFFIVTLSSCHTKALGRLYFTMIAMFRPALELPMLLAHCFLPQICNQAQEIVEKCLLKCLTTKFLIVSNSRSLLTQAELKPTRPAYRLETAGCKMLGPRPFQN